MKRKVKAGKSVRTSKCCRKGILFSTVPKKISYGVLLIFALIGLWLVLLSVKATNSIYAIP